MHSSPVPSPRKQSFTFTAEKLAPLFAYACLGEDKFKHWDQTLQRSGLRWDMKPASKTKTTKLYPGGLPLGLPGVDGKSLLETELEKVLEGEKDGESGEDGKSGERGKRNRPSDQGDDSSNSDGSGDGNGKVVGVEEEEDQVQELGSVQESGSVQRTYSPNHPRRNPGRSTTAKKPQYTDSRTWSSRKNRKVRASQSDDELLQSFFVDRDVLHSLLEVKKAGEGGDLVEGDGVVVLTESDVVHSVNAFAGKAPDSAHALILVTDSEGACAAISDALKDHPGAFSVVLACPPDGRAAFHLVCAAAVLTTSGFALKEGHMVWSFLHVLLFTDCFVLDCGHGESRLSHQRCVECAAVFAW